MTQVVSLDVVNFKDADASIEVHSPQCSHMGRYRNHPLFQHELDSPEEWNSAQALFDDYNADFYDEDPDGIWAIRFFPCSGLVSKTTVINSMSY